jgi:hypothetical protein
VTTDQRGLPRVYGAAADIGAFEVQVLRVASVAVNGGAAQRSRVTDLTVTFEGPAVLPANAAAAFTLTRNSDGAAVSFTATASVVGGVTVVRLNAFTGAATEFGSLADGRYTLTVLGSQVTDAGGQQLDGDNDGAPGGNNVTQFFRFYGDVNGDGVVNGLDFGIFRSAFGTATGDPAYLAALDFNNDGAINGLDFAQFRARFGTALP